MQLQTRAFQTCKDNNVTITRVLIYLSFRRQWAASRRIPVQFFPKFVHQPLYTWSRKPKPFQNFTISHVGQNGSLIIRPRSSRQTKNSASGRHFV